METQSPFHIDGPWAPGQVVSGRSSPAPTPCFISASAASADANWPSWSMQNAWLLWSSTSWHWVESKGSWLLSYDCKTTFDDVTANESETYGLNFSWTAHQNFHLIKNLESPCWKIIRKEKEEEKQSSNYVEVKGAWKEGSGYRKNTFDTSQVQS